jgi:hypothetical protein
LSSPMCMRGKWFGFGDFSEVMWVVSGNLSEAMLL